MSKLFESAMAFDKKKAQEQKREQVLDVLLSRLLAAALPDEERKAATEAAIAELRSMIASSSDAMNGKLAEVVGALERIRSQVAAESKERESLAKAIATKADVKKAIAPAGTMDVKRGADGLIESMTMNGIRFTPKRDKNGLTQSVRIAQVVH